MTAITVDDVSVSFGGVHALRNVSLAAAAGERIAIVGPNGAGKSTLLHVVGGQLKPTAGRVRVFDRDVTALTPDRRAELGIARTFQTTNLFGALTVEQNVR